MPTRRSIRAPLLVLGSLMVVGSLAFLAPLGAAAVHPATPTVYRAPFSGYPLTASTLSKIGCASGATTPKAPTFLNTTGRALQSDLAKAAVCGSPHSFSRGAVNTTAGLFGANFTVPTSGTHRMAVHWSLTWSLNLTAMAGNVTQIAFAQSGIQVYAEVDDATSGATLHSSNQFSVTNTTVRGSVLWHATALKVSLFVNGTLRSGHTYYFVTFVNIGVVAFVSQPGTSVAIAALNMGTSGNRATLLSMSVS